MSLLEDHHKEICERASDLANQSPDIPQRLYGNRLFRPAVIETGDTPLTIDYDRGILELIPQEEKEYTIQKLQEIGTAALVQAVMDKKALIAKLIVKEAKKGNNYMDLFDRDKKPIEPII